MWIALSRSYRFNGRPIVETKGVAVLVNVLLHALLDVLLVTHNGLDGVQQAVPAMGDTSQHGCDLVEGLGLCHSELECALGALVEVANTNKATISEKSAHD